MGATKDERKPIQLTEDMKEKIERFIKGFVDAPETCEAVIEHLKHKEPSGGYFPLAKYFKYGVGNPSFIDICYKMWMANLIYKGRETESIVLSCLKEKYKKEELENFVFLKNNEKPEYNQKWHFFISYWGYIEFVTLFNIECEIKTLYERKKVGNNFRCTELKTWYETFDTTDNKK